MKLVQVGAEVYFCRAVRSDPIKRGDVVEVDDSLATHLLGSTYRDIANNVHPYFTIVEGTSAPLSAAAPEAAPLKRRRKAKAEEAGSDGSVDEVT
jgi:hypothetical protein